MFRASEVAGGVAAMMKISVRDALLGSVEIFWAAVTFEWTWSGVDVPRFVAVGA